MCLEFFLNYKLEETKLRDDSEWESFQTNWYKFINNE